MSADSLSATSERPCTRCGKPFPAHEPGVCPFCAVVDERQREQDRRRKAAEFDRARLGFTPLTRATNMTRIAVDAGLYWSQWAASFADGATAVRLDRIRDHLTAARREL